MVSRKDTYGFTPKKGSGYPRKGISAEEQNMKTTIAFATALGAVLVLSLASLAVTAFGNGPSANYDPQVHEALVEAMEDADFEAWRAIREENGLPMHGKMMRTVNAENFDRFLALREANRAGDVELAKQIREELGANTFKGPHGNRFGTDDSQGLGQRFMRGNCFAGSE
jgi:hypothetical protein